MPSIELQTFLATLPPQQKEAILKLPEDQQLSIMNDSLKTSGSKTSTEPVFNFDNENDIGLKLEKTQPQVQTEEKPKKTTTKYVIQNNTGLNYYANLQGQARQLTDKKYEKIDLEREIKVLKQNNSAKIIKNLPAGETLILEGEIDTSKMNSPEQVISKYLKGQTYLKKQEALQKETKNKEIERQKKLTGEALKKSVVKQMEQNYSTAKLLFETQMKKDGWAGDVADGVSALWNNGWWNITGNRAKFVREDLEKYKKQTATLEQANKDGNYNQKFKEIFGIDYNEKNIKIFNEKEEKFKEISTSVAIKESLENQFGQSIKQYQDNHGQYKDHTEILHGPTGSFKKKTPAQFLLISVETNLQKLVGKDNLSILTKKAGIDLNKATHEEKYKFYMNFIQKMMDAANIDEKNKLNGKKPEEYLNEFENATKQAFGTKNNIQERVIKYNGSQEVGAATVKGLAKSAVVAAASIAIVASGGTATPLVIGGLTAGASIGVEISDKASNEISQDMDKKTIGTFVQNGLLEGAAAFGGAFLTKGIMHLKHFNGKYTQKAWSMASDGASGAVEGTVTDYVKGGMDNVSQQSVAARALISSTFGSVKVFTDNKAILNGLKITKSGVTSATLQEIKLEIKNKSNKDKNFKDLYQWIEKNPQEFEEIVKSELTSTENKK